MKKYCKYCGTKLTKVESGLYDEETGKKEYDLLCRNKNCVLEEYKQALQKWSDEGLKIKPSIFGNTHEFMDHLHSKPMLSDFV